MTVNFTVGSTINDPTEFLNHEPMWDPFVMHLKNECKKHSLNENPNQFSSHRVTIETKNQSRNPRPITGGIKSQNFNLPWL